jgi:hypothetical protein
MKTYWKNKWTKALRSGKYKQGTGYLRSADKEYCCLGVLCDIVAQSPTGKKLGIKWNDNVISKGKQTGNAVLPVFIRKIVGLKTNDGLFGDYESSPQRLTVLNDDDFLSFKKIADVIDKHHKEM